MRHLIKRAIALILSVTLTTMVMSSVVLPYADAADAYYIKFKNAADKITTTIVENAEIHIERKLPDGYRFDDPPFAVMGQGNTNGNNLFKILEYEGVHSLRALDGSAGGTGIDPKRDSSATYVLKPNLLATISDSTGTASLTVLGASGVETSHRVGIEVNRKPAIEIIEPSSFKLTIAADETDTNKSYTFKTLEATDVSGGVFSSLVGVTPIDMGSTRTDSGERIFKVAFGGADLTGGVYTFKVNLDKDDRIKAGTTFDIYYNLQAVNSLTLTVITPRKVLETVCAALNTPTTPSVADGKYAYVNTDDSLTAIRSHFTLLQQVAMFNDPIDTKAQAKVAVDWAWVPEDPTYDKALTLGGNESGNKIRSAIVVPQMQQVRGHLAPDPTYRLIDGTLLHASDITGLIVPKVPIIIMGQGSLPRLVPTNKMIPIFDAGTGKYELKEFPTVEMPYELDVYNRNTSSTAVEVSAQLEFGKDLGSASKVVVTSSNPSALDLHIKDFNIPYTYGTDYKNPSTTAGVVPVKFIPKSSGDVTLTFTFYFKDATGKEVVSKDTKEVKFQIVDSTPLDYAEFSDVKLKLDTTDADIAAVFPSGELEYGFSAEKTMYNVSLPYKATKFTVAPVRPINKGVGNIVEYRTEKVTPIRKGTIDLNDPANNSFEVTDYPLGTPFVVVVTATAQSGTKRDYRLTITRQAPETDSKLSQFEITNEKNEQLLSNFVPTTYTYNIVVPYGTRWVKPKGKTSSLWAKPPVYTPTLEDKDGFPTAGEWLRLYYPTDPIAGFGGKSATTTLTSKVVAEDNKATTTYTFNITRKDPSTNDRASALVFKDKAGKVIELANGVKFDKDTRRYDLRIPYSLDEITVEVTAEDAAALKGEVITSKMTSPKDTPNNTQGKPMIIKLETTDLPDVTVKTFDIKVGVYPESSAAPVPYVIKVTRNDPDNDNYLSALKVQDQDGDPITSFSFNPLTPDYIIPVPYKAESVTITPTTRSPLARVEIDGIKIDQYTPAYMLTMKPGEKKTVSVKVYPENLSADPPYREYKLELTRAQPSTDARLVSLKVTGGEEFLPIFDPNKTAYSVTMPEGTTSITVTAEPKDKASTLLINGESATSGQPSNAITPIDATSNIPIVVTAEDGKTKMTYNITVTNRNLIPKSTNADLKSLTVNYGDMSPRFKPSITEYEVAVKNDAASVDIIPVPAIAGSTVEVFNGTQRLGDYSNNYSSKLADGENEFSITITSEEGKATKTYNIIVYRKDEELQGKYKPITPDMVDYVRDGDIVVDITKYPIVSAEVFNTLKTKYPDKNMIFEGNDYSLTIRGKDLAKLIPHEELFDLSLTFTSPLEDEVWDTILNDYRNSRVDPVFIHFNHHGALPAPMVLTLTLGRQYRNTSATWNYYNEERERIDFYGGIKTNSRGTFSARLTHMSTYLFSDYPIAGAENKSGDLGGIGGLTGGINGSKLNPNTGAP